MGGQWRLTDGLIWVGAAGAPLWQSNLIEHHLFDSPWQFHQPEEGWGEGLGVE